MLPFISYMTLNPSSQPAESCLKGKRIIIIEEDAVTEWQLEKALQRAGLDIVATAQNGHQGLDIINECQPDLVILDVRQSVSESLEIARRILARWRVCIVLLSDYHNQADKERARQSGLCAYLAKPLTGHALVSALEQAYTEF